METPDAGGHRYLASAGNLSLMEGAEALKPAFPQYARKMPMMELPDWFIRAFGWIDKDMRANMSALGVKRAIDNGPAELLLGRALIPPEAALLATAQSLVSRGLV